MPIHGTRIRAVLPWLAEGRHMWLSAGVIILALIVSLRPNTPEPVIRLTGLVLQILGIATVLWGISETRALFRHPSFAAKASSWFRRFPLLHRGTTSASLSGSFTLTCKGRGYSTHAPVGQNPTIDARIESLERNIILIHERITGIEKEIDEEIRKANEALKNEEQARQREDTLLHEKLVAAGTGGVHISAIGASWLFVGVLLSTAGIEIAAVLR